MSCGGRVHPVNPERLGEAGRWVMPRSHPSRSATCVHTWECRNALGVAGGPVVKACTGCGETHRPTWVPDTAARPALPAATPPAFPPGTPFLVGEAEWLEAVQERGAA